MIWNRLAIIIIIIVIIIIIITIIIIIIIILMVNVPEFPSKKIAGLWEAFLWWRGWTQMSATIVGRRRKILKLHWLKRPETLPKKKIWTGK